MFRFIAYIISQWAWLGLLQLGIQKAQNSLKSDSFEIDSRPPSFRWNSSLDPRVFTHDSDVHINRCTEGSKDAFRRILNHAKRYNPGFHVITGDLSDDFDGLAWPKYADQDEAAWRGYREVIDSIEGRNYTIVDMPGNHDMWGLSFIDSPRFFLLDYSETFRRNNTKTLGGFRVRVLHDVDEQHPVIILNPFNFPAAHCCFLYWVEASQQLLDEIEEAILANPHAIVVSHFPPDMWRHNKNSYGHDIREIVAHKNVDLVLTGHSHPPHPVFRHHASGVLEVCGVGGMNHSIYGVVTEDNGRFVYHEIDAKKSQESNEAKKSQESNEAKKSQESNDAYDFLVTHPVPKEQLSDRTVYSERETEIRVLSTRENASIFANGEKLEFRRKTNNSLYLYSLPLSIEREGPYIIEFTGDFNKMIEYYFKWSYKVKEGPIESPHSTQVQVNSLPFILLLFQFILFPVNVFDFNFLNKWIYNQDDDDTNNDDNNEDRNGGKNNLPWWSFWIIDVFAGFLAVRSRILMAPSYIRIILYIAATWPIILPTSIMEIDDKFSMISTYGYFRGFKHVFSLNGPSYTYDYLFEVMIPLTLLASGFSSFYIKKKSYYNELSPSSSFSCSWSFLKKINIAFALDLIYPIIMLSKSLPYTIQYPLSESVGHAFMFFSPCFIIIPLAILICLAIWIISSTIDFFKKDENEISSVPIIYDSIEHQYVIN